MAVSGEYLILVIAVATQSYAIIVYSVVRRRRREGGSSFSPSNGDVILAATILAAIAPVAYTSWLIYSMREPLLFAVFVGFAVLDLLIALFIFGLISIGFVAPTVIILVAALNLIFGLRAGQPLFILPAILFFALGLRSIVRTIRSGRETETT